LQSNARQQTKNKVTLRAVKNMGNTCLGKILGS
jgi:hypothetical protein